MSSNAPIPIPYMLEWMCMSGVTRTTNHTLWHISSQDIVLHVLQCYTIKKVGQALWIMSSSMVRLPPRCPRWKVDWVILGNMDSESLPQTHSWGCRVYFTHVSVRRIDALFAQALLSEETAYSWKCKLIIHLYNSTVECSILIGQKIRGSDNSARFILMHSLLIC